MKRRADLAFSAAILVVAAAMVWQARDWPIRSQLFPLTIGIPTVLLALAQVVLAFRHLRLGETGGMPVVETPYEVSGAAVEGGVPRVGVLGEMMLSAEVAIDPGLARKRLLETSVWILVFAAGIVLLGFTFAAPILVAAFLKIAAKEPWRVTLPLAFGVYLAFFFGFGRVLHVPFPAGVLADVLKLDALDSYVMRPILQVFQSLRS